MLSLFAKNNPKSIKTEVYKTLRTNIQFLIKSKNLKKILVTSSENDDDKSSIISNLAFSFSQLGKKVLVIDCNLRKPSIHQYFNILNHTGISDLITEKLNCKEVIKEYSDTLHIITAGKILINPAELLNEENISPIFKHLENHYDFILIDSPPVVALTDTQLLSQVSDGVVMVMSIGKTKKKLCYKALQMLNNVNANIIGIVLNEDAKLSSVNNKKQYSYYSNEDKKKKKSKRKKGYSSVNTRRICDGNL